MHAFQNLLCCAAAGFDLTLGEPEARHGPLPRNNGSARVVGSVAEELAAAQGSSQVCSRWQLAMASSCRCVFLSRLPPSPPFPSWPWLNSLPAMQVVLEGDLVNLGVTSPAAALALGLMYLQTNDGEVAAAFQLPDTHFAMDFVQPDQLALRMLMRSLGVCQTHWLAWQDSYSRLMADVQRNMHPPALLYVCVQ